MPTGVKYVSYPEHSGYGLAALAYVRALHNAGVPVWWAPLIHRQGRPALWQAGAPLDELPLARGAAEDAALRDLPELIRACGPKPYATVVMHTLPEHWPGLVEPGKRHVGYTVWETDALPAHWPELLRVAGRVCVPGDANRALFAAAVDRPVHAIPHVRRHAWNVAGPAEVAALRGQLDIPDDHFVFYSIGVWDARKAIGDLLRAFARTFSGDDRVTLVLKTSAAICSQSLEWRPDADIRRTVEEHLAAAADGRPPPRVVSLAVDGIPGRTLDTLHALGDCYVSLTHGEGWGMGAFDAASLGKPVLITGYGGPAEYLGEGYPGLIPYALETVSGWVAGASFRSPQRWAHPDPRAVDRLLRRVVTHHDGFMDAAARTAERIANRYAEPVVARQWLEVLDG